MAEVYDVEPEFFGRSIGTIDIAQLTYGKFQQECASENFNKDSTGLRLYSGAHVAIRLLVYYSEMLAAKSVVELGCGVGALGLVGCSTSNFHRLVLTDGEITTKNLVDANISVIYKEELRHKIKYAQFSWGCQETITSLKRQFNEDRPFDVVIGCELMYYRTDINELLKSVLALTGGSGLFLHAHLFRKEGQERELIAFLAERGWTTYEVLHRRFIDADELAHHPEWYKVRALVSGPIAVLEALVAGRADCAHWRVFNEHYPEDEEELGDTEEGAALAGMFRT